LFVEGSGLSKREKGVFQVLRWFKQEREESVSTRERRECFQFGERFY
jgi:hypothetical protein